MQYDDEPVFKRSKWGTNRYYYNPRNPVGLALIIITLLFVGTMMILVTTRTGPFAAPPAPKPWNPPAYDHTWQPLPTASTPGGGAP
ncbi:hypothetical protein [Streptomyces sp. NPDC059072]|uniref:hypothetical protein n=1 Tax=unclassified Streptomyces TaxID=2593676 RepID=UPI00367838A7